MYICIRAIRILSRNVEELASSRKKKSEKEEKKKQKEEAEEKERIFIFIKLNES